MLLLFCINRGRGFTFRKATQSWVLFNIHCMLQISTASRSCTNFSFHNSPNGSGFGATWKEGFKLWHFKGRKTWFSFKNLCYNLAVPFVFFIFLKLLFKNKSFPLKMWWPSASYQHCKLICRLNWTREICVWNENNNIFLEKHDRVCLKHKVWLIQFAAQWTEHSSQLKGNSDHVHSISSFTRYSSFTPFHCLSMNEKIISPLQAAYNFSLCSSLKLIVEFRIQTISRQYNFRM